MNTDQITNPNVETNRVIATTIMEQLGGNRFVAMTGAKHFMFDGPSLSFRLPSRFATGGINYVKIALDASDTYTMTFGKVWGINYKVIKTVSDVYNDNLQRVFRITTGLDTKL